MGDLLYGVGLVQHTMGSIFDRGHCNNSFGLIIIIIIIIITRWSSSLGRVNNIHFSIQSRPSLGPTQPPIHGLLGALSSGVKRLRSEAVHSLKTSVEVKKTRVYTSILPFIA
jgi:hypothetical protein